MKCQLYKDWNLNETITQKIIGKLVNNNDSNCDCVTNNNDTNIDEKQTWHISSQVLGPHNWEYFRRVFSSPNYFSLKLV